MTIYPAIDLLDGCCVRLQQGDFAQATIYSNDPLAQAGLFAEAGAQFLHVVDLSGAKEPERRQIDVLKKVLGFSQLKIQVGGGIRDFESVATLLALGADRVVIGSAAVSNPDLVIKCLREFGAARITVALDVRIAEDGGQPMVALHGWREQTAMSVNEAILPFLDFGLERILCTDIAKDGMMSGPNVALYQKLSQQFAKIEFQASGGVSHLRDLRLLKNAGVRSVIAGKALYEGALDLREALAIC